MQRPLNRFAERQDANAPMTLAGLPADRIDANQRLGGALYQIGSFPMQPFWMLPGVSTGLSRTPLEGHAG